MTEIPEVMPEVTLGCFEDYDTAEALMAELQDLFDKYGTQTEIYLARTTTKSWLVYMTTYELNPEFVKKPVEKVATGEVL